MLYIEYEYLKRQYRDTQRKYDAILTEKEKLFQITQPQGINTEQEKVSGGNPQNTFEKYLILKEQKRIDERLEEVKSLMMDREQLLKAKKEELYQSRVPEDMIYRARYIDRQSVRKIAYFVNYSERQVFRLLKKISSHVKDGRE